MKFVGKITPGIIPWFRYVDDILCIWPSKENSEEFLAKLNEQVPSIKFTIETEIDNCLPFLDILIHREDLSLKYSVYRKPTNILSYVHFFSGHKYSVKQSVFSSMYLRALRIVSPEFLDKEFENIDCIGSNLCYPVSFLETCRSKAQHSFYNINRIENIRPKNVLCLPYCPGFESIVKSLKLFDLHVVFNYENTIGKLLVRNSPRSDNCVIYKIPCKDCDSYYIGQTSKDLKFRISQHKYSVRSGQISNALFIHLSEKSHQIDWDGSSSITNCKSILDRNIIESALIQITKPSNLNISTGLYNLDPFLIDLLKRDLSKLIGI